MVIRSPAGKLRRSALKIGTDILAAGALALVLALAPGAARAWDTRLDRSREGEVLQAHEQVLMRARVECFLTVRAGAMPVPQISTLGRVFRVRPAAIHLFRWGPSAAPAGHPLAQSVWYTIWYEEEDGRGRRSTTLRVDERGLVIEQMTW